jgi:hypothetical protein
MSGNSVALMGLVGRLLGTLGDGAVGVYWFSSLGVGSSTLGVVSLRGSIFSNIAANSFIACILSDPGSLNGVAGAGWRSARARSAATIMAASSLEMAGTLQC